MGIITINNNRYNFKEGETILDVARKNQIDIPVMCYLEHITPTGACRLCLVDVDGIDKSVAACVTYAIDGMIVHTDTEKAQKNRKKMMEFVLMKHPLDCPICDKAGECMLQDTAYSFGMKEEAFQTGKPQKPKSDWDMIIHDPNLCVLCERCVKVCHEVEGMSALKIENRGFDNFIAPTMGEKLVCDFCGICVDNCPVGALLDKPYKHSVRSWDLEKKQSVCTFCPLGCELEYGLKDGEIYRSKSADNGFTCSLGKYAFKYTSNPQRILHTKKMDGGQLVDFGLDEAFKEIGEKTRKIVDYYGSDAVGFLVGSNVSSEEMALAKYISEKSNSIIISDLSFEYENYFKLYQNKFSTFDNIGKLDDLAKSDLIFVIGSDIKNEALGVKWSIMKSAVRNDGKLVVIGLTECEYAYIADAILKADFGDFAGIFEKIKSDKSPIYEDIRGYIKNATRVSFVVGNEYMQAEKQTVAVFSFVDFVGEDKLSCFLNVLDKNNFTASLNIIGLKSSEEFIKNLSQNKIKALFSIGFYPYKSSGNYKNLIKYLDNADLKVESALFPTNITPKTSFFVPSSSYLEQDASFLTIDGRIIKTSSVIEAPKGCLSHGGFLSRLGSIFGIQVCNENSEIFDNYLSGKYSYPELKFNEIDGSLYKISGHLFGKTDFSFRKQPEGTVEVFVNERYHNGFLSSKSAIEVTDGEVCRKYYFKPKNIILSGPGACFDGKCSITDNVAKGVVLIPKNTL